MLISGRMREPNEIRDAGPAPATQLHAEDELAVLPLAAESGRSWRPVQTAGKGPTVVWIHQGGVPLSLVGRLAC